MWPSWRIRLSRPSPFRRVYFSDAILSFFLSFFFSTVFPGDREQVANMSRSIREQVANRSRTGRDQVAMWPSWRMYLSRSPPLLELTPWVLFFLFFFFFPFFTVWPGDREQVANRSRSSREQVAIKSRSSREQVAIKSRLSPNHRFPPSLRITAILFANSYHEGVLLQHVLFVLTHFQWETLWCNVETWKKDQLD